MTKLSIGFFQILQTLSLSLNIYTGTGWRNHDKALNTQYYAIYTLCLTLLFINTSVIEPPLVHMLHDLSISQIKGIRISKKIYNVKSA